MKLTIVLALALNSTLYAADGMKPGLWEHSVAIKSQSGEVEKAMAQMKKQMDSMPAEQRKMMEEMMAKQGMGISNKGSTVKVCISKEQADKLDIPQDHDGNCKHEVVKRSAKSIKMKFTCTGESASSGEGEFTLTSSTSYLGKAVVETQTRGKKERMQMNQSGTWLAADCGKIQAIKPKK